MVICVDGEKASSLVLRAHRGPPHPTKPYRESKINAHGLTSVPECPCGFWRQEQLYTRSKPTRSDLETDKCSEYTYESVYHQRLTKKEEPDQRVDCFHTASQFV